MVTKTELGELLMQQTATLLGAMDEKFAAQDKRIEQMFIAQNIAISAELDKRFAESDRRFNEALNKLTNTIDKLLKKTIDLEEEFVLTTCCSGRDSRISTRIFRTSFLS